MLRSLHSISRWQAFGIHLLISLGILVVLLLLVFLLWYPSPYYHIINIWILLALLITVDVIIGPLLTLLVFKPGKKGLAFDLSCIAFLQIVALGYGTTTIYLNRPFWQVFAVDRFNVLSIKDVDMNQLADPGLAEGFHFGPRLVYADVPTDPAQVQRILQDVLSGGPDVERRADLYRPYGDHVDSVLARAKTLDQLGDEPETVQRLAEFFSRHGGSAEDYRYLPLMGGSWEIAQVISADNGELVGTILTDPW